MPGTRRTPGSIGAAILIAAVSQNEKRGVTMINRKRHRFGRFSGASMLVLAAAAAAGAAHAQAQAPASPAQQPAEVEEIVVTGYRASLEKSLEIKKAAAGIVDAITAEDIGKFPDLNLSESLQRVPGVTLDRNANGEGQTINLRGLGPQFTRVEIDGMTGLPNGTGGRFGVDEGGRAFNFEILPSELFTTVKVFKTVTPDQTEGGLAGVVQLETPKPFDHEGFRASASVLGDYSDNSGKTDPRASVLVSQNWGGVFGIAASFAASQTHFVTDTAEGGSWRPFSFSNTGTRAPDDVRAALVANGTRYYHFDEDRKNYAGTLAAQYRPSDQLEFTVDSLFGKLKSNAMALRDDMAIEGGANNPVSTTIQNGIITAGQFTGIQQRVGDNFYTTDETLGQVIGRANWQPGGGWSIKPEIGYARRKANRTWNLYSFRLSQNGKFDPGVVSYRLNGDFVDFGSTATDFVSDPQDFLFNVFVYRPTEDVDSEFQTKLDVEKTFDSPLKAIRAGVRYADNTKDRIATQSRLNVAPGVANSSVPNLSAADALVDWSVDGSTGPGQLLSVNEDLLNRAFFPNGAPVAGAALTNFTGYGAQQTYRIEEKTLNAYVSAEYDLGGLQAIGGVRLVRTQQISSGSNVANINLPTQVITPVSFSKTYTKALPSITVKYELADDLILRGGYSRTLTRPDLASLAPSETVAGIDASGGTGTKGNPNLDPYVADNFDLGIERYFGRDAVIAADVFYKKMDGFIDTQTFVEQRTFPRQADGVLVTGPITFTQPTNSVAASVKGLELAAQSRFFFLPGLLQNTGFQANYTYTSSSADFAVANDVRHNGLPGLSKQSWNATLYYSAPKMDVRLSYAWRSRYLAQFSDDFGIPRFVNAYGQLDFSATYNVTSHLSVQLQGLNLTREQEVDVSSAAYLPYGVDQLDRRILFGVRATF
jgi:TonB-dependent receptor